MKIGMIRHLGGGLYKAFLRHTKYRGNEAEHHDELLCTDVPLAQASAALAALSLEPTVTAGMCPAFIVHRPTRKE